jgi:hypothetical protein
MEKGRKIFEDYAAYRGYTKRTNESTFTKAAPLQSSYFKLLKIEKDRIHVEENGYYYELQIKER